MAKIKFISVLKDGRGRMEDVVFSSWKGRLFMKPYKKQHAAFTEEQQKTRKSFTAVSRNWKSLAGIVRASWEKQANDLAMTAYNVFMGVNINLHREEKALILSNPMGKEALMGFTAATGSASGTIETGFSGVTGGQYVTFFVQKKEDTAAGGSIRLVDCGLATGSSFTVSGLEAGKEYDIYAVVTDNAYAEAKAVSASVYASAVSGA